MSSEHSKEEVLNKEVNRLNSIIEARGSALENQNKAIFKKDEIIKDFQDKNNKQQMRIDELLKENETLRDANESLMEERDAKGEEYIS